MKIIPISGDFIRKKWLTHYHEIEKKLSKLKRTWNAFEEENQTSYQQWYHSTFAKSLSALNSAAEELYQIQIVLSAIDAQIAVNHLSKNAALKYVLTAIKDKRDPFPDQAEMARYRDAKKKMHEQEFEFARRDSDDEQLDFGTVHPPVYSMDPQNADNCKLIYRKIVKRLHPDRGTEMNHDEKMLWAEAQRAYRLKDEESLRAVLLRVEGGGVIHVHAIDSIGEIIDVTLALYAEYEEINLFQRRTKKEFRYRFWASRNRPKNRETLRSEIQSLLSQQLFQTSYELRILKAELNRLERTTQREKKRRPKTDLQSYIDESMP